jgi:predicted phosphodiesterase
LRRAIISDIHGNLEALEVVLADIKSQGIDTIFCLGDIVGYGPNPRDCLDLVISHCKVCLLGNHDMGALCDPEGFNANAERAIFWTREQLERTDDPGNQKRLEFLGGLPRHQRDGQLLFVHGSPRNPLSEYVFPDDIYNHRKMERLFSLFENVCFQGHTHIPGVFNDSNQFLCPSDFNYEITLDRGKAMVNVGSVGQPRDRDRRSCYVILDDGRPTPDSEPAHAPKLTYRRLEYPFETTRQKIHSIPALDRFLGDRLCVGH